MTDKQFDKTQAELDKVEADKRAVASKAKAKKVADEAEDNELPDFIPAVVDPAIYNPGFHPVPKRDTLYPSPNIEVEAQNQLDSERAKKAEIAEAEATVAKINAIKREVAVVANKKSRIAKLREKMEADFAAEEAKILADSK